MNLKFTKSKKSISFRSALILLSIVGFVCFGSTSFAQIVIGTVTTGNTARNPFMYWYGYGRDASIYTAAEMATTATGGTITTLSWNSSIASSVAGPTIIYLKAVGSTTAVSSTASWADNLVGATQVYSGTPASFVTGWNTIDITDFPILAGQNLMVLVQCDFGGGGTGGQTGTAFYYSAGGTGSHGYWQKDNSAPTGTPGGSTDGGVNTSRPQITIGGLPIPSCTSPSATFTVVPNCSVSQYSVNVNITNMGSATSIGFSDGTNTYPSATAIGNYPIGPFASGSTKTITLIHNGNVYCNIVSTPQTYACPPVNDEAINAIPLSLNTDLACATTTNGTTVAATASSDVAPSCSTSGTNDDVWYKFTATSPIHQFKFSGVSAGTMAVALYTGTPGALVATTDCSSGATVNFTDLIPATQYYARVYTTSSSNSTRADFTVCLGTSPNMTYDSVTTIQASSSSVLPGTTDAQILNVKVFTNGATNPINATVFNFATAGTITAGEITNARLYYTGSSSSFANTTLFGTAVANPNGTFSIVGSQALTADISGATANYFWLVYDVSCNAVVAHTADATCSSVTAAATPRTPTITDPAGSRAISALAVPVFTSPSASSVSIGTVDFEVGRINFTGSNCATSVNEVRFNVGTSPSVDIAQAKCYYTTTSSSVVTTTPFGNAIVHPTGEIVFTGTQPVTPNSSNYFWLAYDVDCAATTTLSDSLYATPVSITSNMGLATVAPLAANKKKGIVSAAVPAYVATTTTNVAAGSANLSIGRTNITGSACSNLVTQVKFNTATSVVSDIIQAKCYYTTSTTFSTTTPFGSAVVNPNGDITFTGSQSLAVGTGNYFWLTYDVACSAVLADSLVGLPVSITANANTATIAAPSTNRKKGITALTTYNTIADGDWSSPATWACGTPPSASSNIMINNNVTVATSGNVAASVTIASGGSLTISSGSLTMGPVGGGKEQLINNGALNVGGGTLNVNGSVLIASGSTFTQSGGDIIVDGNDGTIGGSATGNIFSIGSSSSDYSTVGGVSLTGGRILIVDPSIPTSTSIYSFVTYLSSTANNITASLSHTLQLGDGISSTAGGSTNGFYIYFWLSTGAFKPGNYVINTGSGTNRFVTQQYRAIVGGNLNIISGELKYTSTGPYIVAGNITVGAAGILTSSQEIALGDGNYTGGTSFSTTPSTNAQTVSGAGIFRNDSSTPTANFGALSINNTNANGVTFDANALLNGTNTGTVSGTFTMTTGTVNVGANTFVLGTSPTSTGTYAYTAGVIMGKFKRWMAAGTGANSFDLGSPSGPKKAIINFTTAPTTGGSLTASFNAADPGSNGLPLTEGSNTYTNASSLGYWTISAGDGLTGGTYTGIITGIGFNDVSDYTALTIGKRPTSSDPWALVGTQVAPTGSNSNFVLSRTGMTGFSDFAILNTQVPLEMKLVSFTGYHSGAVNNLNWTTATERDASHFEVLRSENGKSFETIGKVEAANKISGSKYSFVDETPLAGKNFYKLSMVDRDGKSVLSNVIELSSKTGSEIAVTVHPNPVSNLMQINIAGKVNGKASILILDVVGKVIQTITPTGTDIAVDMTNMPAGTYIVKYVDNSSSFVTKITKN